MPDSDKSEESASKYYCLSLLSYSIITCKSREMKMRNFFNSEWSLSGEISHGLEEFTELAPEENWRLFVLSGWSSNVLSIRRILAYSNLKNISGVYRIPDEKKPEMCEKLGIHLYFDDKPDILPFMVKKGIKTIHISPESYSNSTR